MIRTLLADHGELSLIGLRTIFNEVPRIDVVGSVNDGNSLLTALAELKPDVVLIDHTSEGFSANSIRDGVARARRTRFVSITPEPSIMAVTSAVRAGVSSYVRKDCTVPEIIDAVLQTADGDKFFCGKVLETLRKASIDLEELIADPLTCAPVTLTARECQVIALIAEGCSYTRIAEQLALSAHTVNTHRRNIMQKLGVNNKAAVVMYAIKNGLVRPNHFLFDQH